MNALHQKHQKTSYSFTSQYIEQVAPVSSSPPPPRRSPSSRSGFVWTHSQPHESSFRKSKTADVVSVKTQSFVPEVTHKQTRSSLSRNVNVNSARQAKSVNSNLNTFSLSKTHKQDDDLHRNGLDSSLVDTPSVHFLSKLPHEELVQLLFREQV